MEGNESPLTPFLASLAADGIYLTLRDYERVHLALQTSGPWTLIRLRDTLLALLAKDEEQYALLRRRFHEFFAAELAIEAEIAALDTQQVLTDLRHLAAERPAINKPKPARLNLTPRIFSQSIELPKVKLGFWTAWFVLLVVGLGMVSYLLFLPATPPPVEVAPPTTRVAELAATPATLPVAQARKRLYTGVPYVADIRYEPLESFPLWQRYAGVATFFFFAALLYGRRLPEPFLRLCVYHHIRFDDKLVERAIASRRTEFHNLSDDFLRMALQRFLALRDQPLRKQPATGELLVWLRVLALAVGTYPAWLEEDLAKLPYLGVLLKDRQDIEELGGGISGGNRHVR